MSSTQHQLIEQCATRLRGIVEALDNIHDSTPHRWSADLDDVHSSAESLLALIKDQAPTQAAQDLALRTIAEYPCPEQDNMTAANMRQVAADAITGALAFGAQASQPPAEDHWLRPFYDIGRAEGQRTQELAMLVRMLASSLKRHAPESNLVARATNYLAAKGLAGTPLRDAPASVEQAGGDERASKPGLFCRDCGSRLMVRGVCSIYSAEKCGIALEVCAKVQTPLMTVAQHERIVGALRAVITQLHQHKNDYMDAGQETYRALQNEIREREAEIARLDGLVSVRTAERDHLLALIDSPELHDFANGVVLEAAHQRKRWGSQHDAGKQPADWFWLIGYLAGKALHACATGNTEKALHHCISSAAALGNWHASLLGADTSMRPGLPTESLPISAGGSDHA